MAMRTSFAGRPGKGSWKARRRGKGRTPLVKQKAVGAGVGWRVAASRADTTGSGFTENGFAELHSLSRSFVCLEETTRWLTSHASAL
jgi:hypothetical protein